MLTIDWLRTRMHYLFALLPTLSFSKFFNALLGLISYKLKRSKSGKVPAVLAIHLTHRCNFSCTMCQKSSLVANEYTDEPEDMDFNALEHLLRENAKYISIVRLGGGEPLYFGKIRELIHLLDELKLKYVIITNGSLLDPEISKLLMKNCLEISFSIDSADSAIYSKMRTPGTLDVVTENIRFLNRQKIEQGTKTPILNLAATTFTFNLSGLPDLIKFCHVNRIPTISVSEGGYYNTPGIRQEHLIRNIPEEVDLTITEAKSIAKRLGVGLRLNSPILNTTINGPTAVRHKIDRCMNFYLFATVYPSLDVFSCALSYAIGDLTEKSLSEVWNGDEHGYVKARKMMKTKELPASCRLCNDINSRELEGGWVYSYTFLQEERFG